MAFTRNMDPKDSMEIGRKKDAIEIKEIVFSIRGCPIELKYPNEIIEFLKKFQDLDFPKDLIFAPHNIVLKKEEIVEDYSMDLARALAAQKNGYVPPYRDPVATKKVFKEIRLYEYAGKTILYCGNFFEMPSIAKIIEKRINYLTEDEERYLKRKEEEEEKKFKEMSAMLDLFKMKQAMKIKEAEMEEEMKKEMIKSAAGSFIMKKTDAIIKLVNGLL